VPPDLPAPIDDGACDALLGQTLPATKLTATTGVQVALAQVPGWVVIYCYPMTGRPGRTIPEGWVQIPGAAGCTPQSCAFRDNFAALQHHNVRLFGLSAQSSADQQEAATRLELPYPLLSDSSLLFSRALGLPLFEVAGLTLIKRLTLIVQDGVIKKVFYPVFPPDKNVLDVIEWFQAHHCE
jgi:peroxiredoxin